MYEEIEISSSSKIIFFKDHDFWDKIVSSNVEVCDYVTIVTYNFNFSDYRGDSFFSLYCELLKKGCFVRLIYSKANGAETVTNLVNKFGHVMRCVDNHSKMFIANSFAYFGSANFSRGSNSNIEIGFITTDKSIIEKMRELVREFFKTEKSELIVSPEDFWVSDEYEKTNEFLDMIDIMKSKVKNGEQIGDSDVGNLAKISADIGNYKSLKYRKSDIFSIIDNLEYADSPELYIKKTNDYLDELREYVSEYKGNMEYILGRGGQLRLLYENGEISLEEYELMNSRCLGNESIKKEGTPNDKTTATHNR